MFHYDRGLRITSIDLGVDMRRRQPRGFISHAHTDHMARHELAYCTPATAELYQHRYGPRATHLMRFGEPLAGLRVVQHPLVHAISLIYERFGCELGPLERCEGNPPADAVVVAPPRRQKAAALTGLRRPVSIGVTGWAIDPSCRWRLGVD